MRVGIIGASGYTGGELLRILSQHEKVEVEVATSRSYSGKPVYSAHPNLRGILNIEFENPKIEEIVDRCDFVFLALPHGESMKHVPRLLEAGVKVVDLSGDFRFEDTSVYEEYYGRKHEAPEIKAVYGLPELNRHRIKKAELVANPGCYPTAAILCLAPAVKEGIIEDGVVVDAKSGISGAGVKPTPKTHFPNADENILAYKITAHQHLPEMEQELRKLGKVRISFVPHIIPVIRGISCTVHCFLKDDLNSDDVIDIYSDFYAGEPFVRVIGSEIPRLSSVRGSNFVDIGGFGVDAKRKRIILVSTIDNLVKGASGQAVQNMNIMLGFNETEALLYPGLHP